MQLLAINARAAAGSCTLAQATVIRRVLETPRAHISGTLVKGVEVTSSWGLLRQRQVGLRLLDFRGLVGVLVDDGLYKLCQRSGLCLVIIHCRSLTLV